MNFLKSKYQVIFAFSAILLLCSCHSKNSVSIRVKATSSKDSKVYLDRMNFSSSIVVDSMSISKGSDKVNFRVRSVSEPTFFILRVRGKGAITLLADPGEKMELIINTDKMDDYTVLGSKGSLKTKELSRTLNQTNAKLYSLRMKYNLAQNQAVKSMVEQEYQAVIDSQRVYSTRFIWANAMSRASVMAVYQKFDDDSYVLDRPEDLQLFKMVASSLRAMYPSSDYTKGMIDEIKKIEGVIKSNKMRDFVSRSVSSIPDIELPNPRGEMIKLSQFKGKVILLDFWASWDQLSIMDNRELLDIYKQFKSRGFEIYQVSLDTDQGEWVNAIESAGLPWPNVSELNPKGSVTARIYNVTQLPTNYLIDRSHTIIDKNLTGEALRKRLREVL